MCECDGDKREYEQSDKRECEGTYLLITAQET
jgi:hypothetical protein